MENFKHILVFANINEVVGYLEDHPIITDYKIEAKSVSRTAGYVTLSHNYDDICDID